MVEKTIVRRIQYSLTAEDVAKAIEDYMDETHNIPMSPETGSIQVHNDGTATFVSCEYNQEPEAA